MYIDATERHPVVRPENCRLLLLLCVLIGLDALSPSMAQSSSLCEATTYGVSTSLADNTAAFSAALLACKGHTMHVRAGSYRFAPGQFVAGIVVPDATSIVGDGAAQTTLQITGPGNYDSFFWIRNASNVSIRGLTLRGNGVPYRAGSCVNDYGRAISIVSDAGKSSPATNISIASNVLINFVGTGWISLFAAKGSPGIGTIAAGANVTIEGNFFQSAPGNAVAPDNPNCNSAGIELFGAGLAANIVNVLVSANGFDAGYLKQGIIVYGSASQVVLSANSISGAGHDLTLPKDSSLYGVLIYQKDIPPTDVKVLGNNIPGAHSCGIYVAAGRNITISGNTISGQADTNDDIEPKGAICLNHIDNAYDGSYAPITGNTISSSNIGISVSVGSVPNVSQNSIASIPFGGVGIKVKADSTTTVSFSENSVSSSASNVSSFIGFGLPASTSITDLLQTGVAFPLRWYHDTSAAQPFCNFSDVGSISGVLVRANASLAFTAQNAFLPTCH
jgi:hypothetical protein